MGTQCPKRKSDGFAYGVEKEDKVKAGYVGLTSPVLEIIKYLLNSFVAVFVTGF